jgi:serine/threonine protein phosphatase 1
MKTPSPYRRAPLRWLQRSLGKRARNAAPPSGEAVYAIGDIHGRVDLLDDLLTRIERDANEHPEDQSRRLVFLGDYVDRGTASRAVIERLLQDPLPGFAKVFLMGNHERAMLDFLEGGSDGSAWRSYGGIETLMSYGVQPTRNSCDTLRMALAEALPEEHLSFLRACRLHYRSGDYVFVHAGVRPGLPLEAQDPLDLLWIREDFLEAREALSGRVVVHGHTVCKAPEDLPYRINVDTGAFYSGRLTSLVLRSNTRKFLATAP